MRVNLLSVSSKNLLSVVLLKVPVSLQALSELVPGAGLEPARCYQRGI